MEYVATALHFQTAIYQTPASYQTHGCDTRILQGSATGQTARPEIR